MFQSHNPLSPVEQQFIWAAEYYDGTNLTEFDYNSQEENNFYRIDKSKLVRFGLVGNGVKVYYEVLGGAFKIVGQMIEVKYVTEDAEYALTGKPILYSDVITYKDAEFVFDTKVEGSGKTVIRQYNFGYKTQLLTNGVNFGFQAICQLPIMNYPIFQFKLVSDTDLNGRIVISRSGKVVAEIDAPLRKGVGGELNWEMR